LNSERSEVSRFGLDPEKMPRHVAIIMDGNGRWARKKLMNRVKGHERGVQTVRDITRACRQLGIPFLTLYAFSTENWQRPAREVSALMSLLVRFLRSETPELMAKGIRLNAIGQLDRLPDKVRHTLDEAIRQTAQNESLTLTLALSYGGRAELVRMVRLLAAGVSQGRIDPEQIDEAMVAGHLYTAGMPDPDILIRTSGEMRISNFLLWQIAYTELFVTPTLWPDFNQQELISILQDFQTRERRFGKVET